MSYGFTVQAKDNELTVTVRTSDVPDGLYQVSGHDDASSRNVGVARSTLLDPDTGACQMIVQASSYAKVG